ncbi:acetyl-CoA carboxylase carboxyl transferase subunit alpha [Bacillaceae bacterium SIJ1]|uniref:acetyl-CoA carboxylase carboxyl transferase subunit alpha n=1 Tax=Litoribacterium kuwaitense TaxID=1398745 RepID=UPI0013EBA8B2|nr:acetyl-CoA carboxylase carboxyl transferase subunit alpha [Litoribacterium kuwaitense]NGP45030.1 acetyl-CoA carboxylase carboxyl transferase subunit alpha [Litoribacterium kuwaitense]
MSGTLDFEKPVEELREKIDELKKFTSEKDIDLSQEIQRLEERLKKVEDDVYGNMTPWHRVQLARHQKRPTSLDYIERIFDDFMELHGDRLYGDDAAIVSGIARFQGQPVTVIGEQRGRDTKENLRRNFGMPHPEGYRKALRLMKQAEKFQRPIITLIDTKGAYPGKAAEERGQSEAIAKNLYEMAGLTVPILVVVIGEGASGGALAIGVGNRVYMLENAWYSVIAPESAAVILWKDSTLAQKAAESMKITAPDAMELGILDDIISEVKGGAHRDVDEQSKRIAQTLSKGLNELSTMSPSELREQRYEKFTSIGRVLENQDPVSVK